jgi:hypothetical protein
MSQSQLQTAMSNVSLGTVKGGPSGNVIITFDANLFGESITAPHVLAISHRDQDLEGDHRCSGTTRPSRPHARR